MIHLRLSRRLTALMTLLALPLLCLPLHAATLSVPTVAYPTIQAGIDSARPGDTVLVGDGTYTGPGNVDLDFGGKDIVVRSVHGAAKTIIDCQGSQSNQHRGFNLHNGERSAVIDGFTVKNGYAPDVHYSFADAPGSGGGILATDGTTITNCVVTNCTAATAIGQNPDGIGGVGGGIHGGGVIADCVVTGNSAYTVGGISTYAVGAAIVNCTVSNNSAVGGSAGGIQTTDGSVTGCTVSGNSANGPDAVGGGIDAAAATITGCTITGNTTDGAGGGIAVDAVGIGAGGGTSSISTTIVNCVITGNSAASGGAVSAASASLTNCTVLDNTAPDGAGIILDSHATITNCILRDDRRHQGDEYIDEGSVSGQSSVTVTYCDIDGLYDSPGDIDADPQFVNAAGGDYHLQTASPCLGAGTAAVAPGTDAAGRPRPAPPSIGAYETGYPSVAVAVAASNGTTFGLWDSSDGTATIRSLNGPGQHQYGPYAGWTARTLIVGEDGGVHLLWTHTSGAVSFYLLDYGTNFNSQQQYGPYTGWTVQGMSAAPDGTIRALWTKTDGTATVWTLDATNHMTGQQQYGPYPGWTAKSLSISPDGVERLLWTNLDGTATFWRLDGSSQFVDQHQYGPYAGYTATAITSAPAGLIGPPPNNTSRAVWVGTDGHIALWTLDDQNVYTGQTQYGPYHGWAFQGISLGGDRNARLLWDNVCGQAALWSITPGGAFASNFQFGPY